MKTIKNRYQAESMFCKLFVDAARVLRVPSYGEEPDDQERHRLSQGTVQVVHECEFEDPHFIGGPGAFNFAKSLGQVNRIFEHAEPAVAEVCGALEGVSPTEAQIFRARINEIKAWMLRNV